MDSLQHPIPYFNSCSRFFCSSTRIGKGQSLERSKPHPDPYPHQMEDRLQAHIGSVQPIRYKYQDTEKYPLQKHDDIGSRQGLNPGPFHLESATLPSELPCYVAKTVNDQAMDQKTMLESDESNEPESKASYQQWKR